MWKRDLFFSCQEQSLSLSLSNRIIVQLLRSKRNSLLRKRPFPPPFHARDLISREEYCEKKKKKGKEKEKRRGKTLDVSRAMDTIKVGGVDGSKAEKPFFREYSVRWFVAREGVTFSLHGTDKVPSHFPRSPFAHPPFHASFHPSSSFSFSSFLSSYHGWISWRREKPVQRIFDSFIATPWVNNDRSPSSSKNIFADNPFFSRFSSRRETTMPRPITRSTRMI